MVVLHSTYITTGTMRLNQVRMTSLIGKNFLLKSLSLLNPKSKYDVVNFYRPPHASTRTSFIIIDYYVCLLRKFARLIFEVLHKDSGQRMSYLSPIEKVVSLLAVSNCSTSSSYDILIDSRSRPFTCLFMGCSFLSHGQFLLSLAVWCFRLLGQAVVSFFGVIAVSSRFPIVLFVLAWPRSFDSLGSGCYLYLYGIRDRPPSSVHLQLKNKSAATITMKMKTILLNRKTVCSFSNIKL